MSQPSNANEVAPGPTAPPAQENLSRLTKWTFLAIIALGLAGAAYQSLQAQVDPDELEHLHATWLWSQGLQPFTGFFEHHPPVYWVLLRPIVNSVQSPHLQTLAIRARLFSWLFAAGAVVSCWWFFRTLFGRRAAWWGTALFATYAALSPHMVAIRPDVPSLLLLITGSTLAIDAFGAGRQRREISPWRALLAGVLLASACCVLTKAVFWAAMLVCGMVAFLIREWRGGNLKHLRPLALLLAGAAVPLAIQLAWIFMRSDFKTFWYCNVEVNRALVGSVSKTLQAVYHSWSGLWGWPMISTPLAAVGLGCLLAGREPGALPRKLVVILLTASGIVLILLGNGPWPQYHIPLLTMLAGLAGLGFAAAVDRCPAKAATVALLTLAGLSVAWIFIMVICRYGTGESPLTLSLRPLERVLVNSQPGDTYAAVQHTNPVFLMDAEPKIFMKLVCLHDPGTFDEFARTVATKRPQFIIGLGTHGWMAEGWPTLFLGDYSPASGTSMIWEVQQESGPQRRNRVFLGRYVPLDTQGYVLQRQD